MMKLMLFYAVLSIMFAIPINIVSSSNGEEWFEKMTLNNKELTPLSSWVHTTLVVVFSIATIVTFYNMKVEARTMYAKMQLERSRVKDFEWLKTRTVHVRGLAPHDRKGDSLVRKLNKELRYINGQVLGIINIPNFQRLFDLETKKFDIQDLLRIPEDKEPFAKKCLIAKKYRTKTYYSKQINEIENDIDNEILKPVLSSGHAFVCFDSIESANYCLHKFRLGVFDGVKLSCRHLKDSCKSCIQRDDDYGRKKSTFARFEDIDERLVDDNYNCLMEAAKEPMDIIWSNMGGTRGLYFWRRIGLHFVSVLAVLFLSTPSVILATLKRLDILKIHELELGDYVPFGETISTYLPPLLILGVNLIILIL